MIGRTLGGYRIVEQIGMGGMATVYKAYDPKTDRYIALKTIPQHYAQDETFRARFEREARAIARLEHIHILPVFAYGEEEGVAYMAMRYMDTGTLTERMKHGPMPFDEASRIIGQIASALDYAHQRRVIHRDVKPSNVLLDDAGNTYLTDFGIAKIVEGTIDLTGDNILGTPQYMSPEQCRGVKDLSPASDQYSLGVILYEMVTGRTPYQAETPLAVITMQLMDAPLPPPGSLRGDLPEAAEQVILKTLTREPEQRYPSCGAMASAFVQAVIGVQPIAYAEQREMEPLTAVGIQPIIPVPIADDDTAVLPNRRRTPVWVFGLVILLVLVIVIGGIVSNNAQQGGTQVAQVAEETETPLPPTDTPAPPPDTALPTLDAFGTAQAMNDTEATINAARTALYLDGLTMEATLWTATPAATFTPTATLTPTVTPTATPTEVPQSAILYEEDFEDGVADGWDEHSSGWSVVDDGTGNKVYRGEAGSDWIISGIGSTDWTNYAVEFRMKAIDDQGSAEGVVVFRSVWDTSEYGLNFSIMRNTASLYVAFPTPLPTGGVNWEYQTIAGVGQQDIGLRLDEWNNVRIEAVGDLIRATVNGVVFWGHENTYERGMVTFNVGPLATLLFDDVRVWSLDEQTTTLAPTEVPQSAILYQDDFEDGFANGFSFHQGNWTVVDDGTANKVLEAITVDGSLNASFGPSIFEDGIIEFRLRVTNADYQAQHHVVELGFRNQTIINGDWTEYILVYDPAQPPGLGLTYQEDSGSWQAVEGISGGGTVQTSDDGWLTVRVVAQGSDISVFVNGSPFMTAYDSRIERGALYLGGLGNLTAQFDDIRVIELGEAEGAETVQPSTTTRPIPEAPADAVYLIREDFNDGRVQMEGLSIGSSDWSIVTDETGDGVYEVDNRNQEDYAGFSFGSANWTDYVASYQVRYLNDIGSIGLQVRANGQEYYILDLSLADVYLAYAIGSSEWMRLSTRHPFIEINTWYDVRVEVHGNQISIYIDNTLWISETDNTSERGWLLMFASPNVFAQVDNISVWELAG